MGIYIAGLNEKILSLSKLIYKPIYKFLQSDFWRLSAQSIAFYKALTLTPKAKLIEVVMSFIELSKIEGDYLEFGSFGGNSLALAYHCIKRRRLPMKFYAFDSFEGLPEVGGKDKDSGWVKGQFSCSLKDFKQNLRKKKVNLNEVTIIPGWYDKTLTKETKRNLPIKKAAVILVDCDLYESAVPVLEFIKEYIQDGTIIIFDDWFCIKGHPDKGERRAFREWLDKYFIKATEFHKCDWHGNSFIIHLG